MWTVHNLFWVESRMGFWNDKEISTDRVFRGVRGPVVYYILRLMLTDSKTDSICEGCIRWYADQYCCLLLLMMVVVLMRVGVIVVATVGGSGGVDVVGSGISDALTST